MIIVVPLFDVKLKPKVIMAEEKKKKTRRPSALKRDLQNEKRNLRNRIFKSQVKNAIRNFVNETEAGKKEDLSKHLNTIYCLLDKGVKKNIYKQNKANRLKSKFASKISS